MATSTKYVSQDNLAKFYALIDEKYVDFNEVSGGLEKYATNQDEIDAAIEAGTDAPDPIYNVRVKLGAHLGVNEDTGALEVKDLGDFDDVQEGYYVAADPDADPAVDEGFYKTRTGDGTEADPYVYDDEIVNEAGLGEPDSRIDKLFVDLATDSVYRFGGTTWVRVSFPVIPLTDEDIENIVTGE